MMQGEELLSQGRRTLQHGVRWGGVLRPGPTVQTRDVLGRYLDEWRGIALARGRGRGAVALAGGPGLGLGLVALVGGPGWG